VTRLPPGLRSFERSREKRSARRLAYASIEFCEGGVEELVEFIPSWRRNSAFSASNDSISASRRVTSWLLRAARIGVIVEHAAIHRAEDRHAVCVTNFRRDGGPTAGPVRRPSRRSRPR
jgi:hypothetical protein